ncbi:hypothetical protein B0H11DRAFT_7491 [Mycena galericulata]|nr:hypothetical protein B0H11DRAFT_7491 [Mycena galericulata]
MLIPFSNCFVVRWARRRMVRLGIPFQFLHSCHCFTGGSALSQSLLKITITSYPRHPPILPTLSTYMLHSPLGLAWLISRRLSWDLRSADNDEVGISASTRLGPICFRSGRGFEPGTFQCTTRRGTVGRGTGCIPHDDDRQRPHRARRPTSTTVLFASPVPRYPLSVPDPCPPCGHLDSTTFWLPASSASEIKRRRTRSDANQRRLPGFAQSTRIRDILANGVRGGVR